MSLYREVGGGLRRIAIVAAVALVVGAVAGFVLGRATKGEPTLGEKLADVHDEYQKIPDALELLRIEYPQGVKGTDVVARTEYEAAKADVQRARDALSSVGDDLRAVGHVRVDLAGRQLRKLADLVEQPAPPEQVLNQAQKVRETLNFAQLLGTAG
jgi:hypothetical protein